MATSPSKPQISQTRRSRCAGWLVLFAALALIVLVLVWWLDPRRWGLPLCTFYTTTGLYCPGCGATRATHELLHGRLLAALQHNAMWVVALPALAYAVASRARRVVWGRSLPGEVIISAWFFVVLALIAIVFGIVRNIPLYPFDHLVPPG